ncbi:zinc containing alcohol dehydrogenase superfamily [Trichoderma guizhouense]|uniref:Zinc containing alcohol dehydrogenase superfamily n=1 Tax=Trichoderma guizhouense TaxID=1491466 RepID=A0A1T3CI97_9HYPO|nr:zinc containing alcohol dehydrogenase superfamily [Trichoderma guizhouense]
MSLPQTMKAVVFDGPRSVSIQDRPVPQIQDDEDIIVKVSATALCGSELHVYRGHQPSPTGFIMGHEFTGTVVAAGPGVKSVAVGDKIVAPFTASCGKCFFCLNGATARCEKSLLFGSPKLDGGQAEYVRVPLTDGTVSKAPPSISDEALILMADIFPTGFFGVKSALSLAPSTLNIQESTLVVIGCGPVGLCAIIAAAEQKPKHLFAIDGVDSRLEQARQLGAEPLNFMSDKAGMTARILEATEGRGADLVVEVVGLSPALRTAFDIVRPFGVISSIGVHNAEIPWSGSEAYGKNIRLQMGRCPVRSIFSEALVLLEKKQHLLGFMFENIMPLKNAVQGYTLFDEMKVQKVVFKP